MNDISGIKRGIKNLYHRVGRLAPTLYLLLQYRRAAHRMGRDKRARDTAFADLLTESSDKKCLQIGVKDDHNAKFGDNWVSVDLYDTSDYIDYHYDITDLRFPDASFDVVVCMSILEHVPDPQRAIAELHRVLKPGGRIWIQLPFHYPYHESPKDYWRVSPDGLRQWLSAFEEILCGSYCWTRSALATTSYFLGRKP